MADNVAVTAGTGTTVATDDAGGVHYQKFKLIDGTADSTTVIPGSATKGLYVDPHPSQVILSATSSGLTTATTAYTTADQLGAQLSWSNAVRVSGGTGIIQSATIVDASNILAACDLYLFDRSVTVASDNAAAGVSDADALFCQGVVLFPTPGTLLNNKIIFAPGPGVGFKCDATTLYGMLVTRTGHTFFATSTAITVILSILQD